MVLLLVYVCLRFYPCVFVMLCLVLSWLHESETRSVGLSLLLRFRISSRSIWRYAMLLFLGWGIIASRIWMILGLSFLTILPISDLLVLSLPSVVTLNVSLIAFLDLNPSLATLSGILLLLIFYVGELICLIFSSWWGILKSPPLRSIFIMIGLRSENYIRMCSVLWVFNWFLDFLYFFCNFDLNLCITYIPYRCYVECIHCWIRIHRTWHLDREVYCTGLQNLGSCIAVYNDTYPISGMHWWVFLLLLIWD